VACVVAISFPTSILLSSWKEFPVRIDGSQGADRIRTGVFRGRRRGLIRPRTRPAFDCIRRLTEDAASAGPALGEVTSIGRESE
jgi:hypothetical protein